MAGILGNMFDFNRDGELSAVEQAMEYEFLDSRDEEYEDDEDLTELELSGLDPEELEYMDEDERREALEDAGLDPDDYDF